MKLEEKRDWRAALEGASQVMKLVHLAAREDEFDQEAIRSELLQQMRTFYNDELTLTAARFGCTGRTGLVTNGPILSDLNDLAARDAESIVNTFNYDLAVAIAHIRQEHPRANRHHYAYYLREWHANRASWKDGQIAMMTEGNARNLAQQHFLAHNGLTGATAHMLPLRAVCPICQGLVARGETPVRIAYANPTPVHVNCPHKWYITPDRELGPDLCAMLWMGE